MVFSYFEEDALTEECKIGIAVTALAADVDVKVNLYPARIYAITNTA